MSEKEQLEKAKALFQAKEFSEAAEILTPLANEGGNAEAQYWLGCIFYGLDDPKYEAGAMTLFILSARQGFAPSQYMLGACHVEGNSAVPKDHDKAREWLGKAAAQTHADAKKALDELN